MKPRAGNYRVKGSYFKTVEEAIAYAHKLALESRSDYITVDVWKYIPHLLIAVVSDDANGITVHRLN